MKESALEIPFGKTMKEWERKGTARTKSWGRWQQGRGVYCLVGRFHIASISSLKASVHRVSFRKL